MKNVKCLVVTMCLASMLAGMIACGKKDDSESPLDANRLKEVAEAMKGQAEETKEEPKETVEETVEETKESSVDTEVENNGHYFVKMGEDVWFRRGSVISCYNEKTGQLTEKFPDEGNGELFFMDGYFYLTESVWDDEGNESYSFYCVKPDGTGKKTLGEGIIIACMEEGRLLAVRDYTSTPYGLVVLYEVSGSSASKTGMELDGENKLMTCQGETVFYCRTEGDNLLFFSRKIGQEKETKIGEYSASDEMGGIVDIQVSDVRSASDGFEADMKVYEGFGEFAFTAYTFAVSTSGGKVSVLDSGNGGSDISGLMETGSRKDSAAIEKNEIIETIGKNTYTISYMMLDTSRYGDGEEMGCIASEYRLYDTPGVDDYTVLAITETAWTPSVFARWCLDESRPEKEYLVIQFYEMEGEEEWDRTLLEAYRAYRVPLAEDYVFDKSFYEDDIEQDNAYDYLTQYHEVFVTDPDEVSYDTEMLSDPDEDSMSIGLPVFVSFNAKGEISRVIPDIAG